MKQQFCQIIVRQANGGKAKDKKKQLVNLLNQHSEGAVAEKKATPKKRSREETDKHEAREEETAPKKKKISNSSKSSGLDSEVIEVATELKHDQRQPSEAGSESSGHSSSSEAEE